ncbi:MAG: 5-carboxymethyl-2-hydroxymuconate Delta-isomerase [Neisseria sp.]|nr:5-carboxymethyl-2-hydroxymuconate Delta-isomerase [Neisseria sp.]
MPHLLMEYTDNLYVEPKAALRALNRVLIASGEFEPDHIKSRALCHHDYCVGDGEADAFVHLTLSLLSGRTMAVRAALAENLVAALTPLLQAGVRLQITADVRELERECYGKAVLFGHG